MFDGYVRFPDKYIRSIEVQIFDHPEMVLLFFFSFFFTDDTVNVKKRNCRIS